MKCPACKSTNVRRSRHRPEDKAWRLAFFKAYRCRACKHRFHHLTQAPALGAAALSVISLSVAFALGFVLRGLVDLPPPSGETAAASLPATREAGALQNEPYPSSLSNNPDLLAAAENGDPKAQYRLGMIYFRGEGIEPDPGMARKWIEPAAMQGYAPAQFMLGNMHYVGRGALQSFPLAFKWYEQAAQQDIADAQYRLGMMYRVGQGVETDKSKAFVWFTLAAAQGHARAREALDNLQPALSPEQTKEAQRLAQEWRPVTTAQ